MLQPAFFFSTILAERINTIFEALQMHDNFWWLLLNSRFALLVQIDMPTSMCHLVLVCWVSAQRAMPTAQKKAKNCFEITKK